MPTLFSHRRPRRRAALAAVLFSVLLGGATWWSLPHAGSSTLGACPRAGQAPMPIACVPNVPGQ
ncbi:hypothetical protein [Deinococcus irradiatisoli]|uniref:hypothetical protein n=1 Tax=Deinococcus irradiatisoli TaxID=2202254 RepID=UPI0011B1E7BE|nr:hypothetical protein [Deinococcus irradiatisoli]